MTMWGVFPSRFRFEKTNYVFFVHPFLDLGTGRRVLSICGHHTPIAVQPSHRDTDQFKPNLFPNLSQANIRSGIHPTHRGRANYDDGGFTWFQYTDHFGQTASHL